MLERAAPIRWATLIALLAACADYSVASQAPGSVTDGSPLEPDASSHLDGASVASALDAASVASAPDAMPSAPDAMLVEPLEPRIPAPNGPCPTFVTGTQQIAGLDTAIVAGSIGAVKGPLLFMWHGILMTADQELKFLPSSVRADIEEQGGLIIAPAAPEERDIDDTLALGVWDLRDLEYADHVVACAVRDYNIDPRRIYTMGCIAGADMAGAFAVHRSSYVAALAPSSGGLTSTSHALDNPDHAPPAFAMHGPDNEALVLQGSVTVRMLHDVLGPAGGFFVECTPPMSVCGPPELLENAWTFLQAHPFGVSPEPYAQGLPADFPSYCTVVH